MDTTQTGRVRVARPCDSIVNTLRTLLTVLVLATGCVGDPTGGAGAGSGAMSLDELQAAWATFSCKVIGCKGAFFSTPTGCADFMAAQGQEAVMREIALVKAGLSSYDGTQARLCVDAVMASTSCDFSQKTAPAACGKIFVGKGKTGAACSDSGACASGLCAKLSNDPLACGSCTAVSKEGDACAGPDSCSGGLTCESGKCAGAPMPVAAGGDCNQGACAAGLYCAEGSGGQVCTALADKDAACPQNPEPTTPPCKPGLVCAAKFAGSGKQQGTCVVRHKLGEPCSNISILSFQVDCEDDLMCGWNVPKSSKDKITATCVPRGKLGGACEYTNQCGIDGACVGGKCAEMPKAGAACLAAPNSWGERCAEGLLCNSSKLCVGLPVAGQDCVQTSGKCSAGHYCNGQIDGKCRAVGKLGEACAPDYPSQCAFGLSCGPTGKCAAPAMCK